MPFTEGADALATATVVRPDLVWRQVGGVGNPAFYSNWAHVGGAFMPVQFAVLASGWISLRGVGKQTGTSVSIFTLPSGYRPSYTEVFESVYATSYCAVIVNTAGLVYIESVAGAPTKDLTVSLSGIDFDPA